VRIGILEGDSFSNCALEQIAGIGLVEKFDGVSLKSFLADKEILFVRLGYMIDSAFLNKASRLKVLCSPTTGHNHIDEKVLSDRNIGLISLRGESAFLEGIRATPEHTLGLILALLRNYRVAFLDTGNRHWDRDRCRGEELFGMKVGIIGLGRVGMILANYLYALGAKVRYIDIRSDFTHSNFKRYNSLAKLISSSELVTMCAAHVEELSPIMDQEHIKLLRGKYFVNTARGELVDEVALLDLVCEDGLKGLATDVITHENGPNRLDEWLATTTGRNIIVTPHIAGATWTSMAVTEEFITKKLLQVIKEGLYDQNF
jgi:D-3-phosphoglycerate dehydrogenase